MIMNMVGGGGAGLNFTVKAYKSLDAVPASAAENTIAVITETAISEWSISSVEPDVQMPGMLWIYSGKSGAVRFNALKKNAIVIFPGSVMQFVNGAWAYVDAHIFQNGQWIQFALAWNGYYFDNGEQHNSITGGWTSDGYKYWGNTMKPGTLDATLGTRSDGANTASMIGTANPVDLTNVDTIYLTVDTVYGTSQFRVMASKEVGADDLSIGLSVGELTVDVSSLTGSYYLAVASVGGQTYPTAYATVSAVWRNNASSGGGESGIALLALDNDPSDNAVFMEVEGMVYGIKNATMNDEPSSTSYDFTVL